MTAPKKPFEELMIPRKAFYSENTVYQVFGPDGACKDVAAETVQDAIKQSGIENPVRVQRSLLSAFNVLDSSILHGDGAAEEGGAEAADASAAAISAEQPSEQPEQPAT